MSTGNVTVKIDGDQTGANQVFEQAEQRATQAGNVIREKFGVEGLKGEGRVHSQLLGLFRDAKNAGSGIDLVTIAVERLGESFKLALPLMLAFTIAIEIFKGISDAIKEARERQEEFNKTMRDFRDIDIASSTVEGLEKIEKQLDDMRAKYEGRNWFTKLLDIDGNNAEQHAIAALDRVRAAIQTDRLTALNREGDEKYGTPAQKHSAEVAKVHEDFTKRREAQRAEGDSSAVIAKTYELEAKAIDDLEKKYIEAQLKAADEVERKRREGVASAIDGVREKLAVESDAAEQQIRDNERIAREKERTDKEIADGKTDAAAKQAEEARSDISRAIQLAAQIKAAEDQAAADANRPSKLRLSEREWRQRRSGGTNSLFSGGAHDIFSNHAIGGPLFGGTGKGAAGAGATDPADVAKQQRATANLVLQEMKNELTILNAKLMGTG